MYKHTNLRNYEVREMFYIIYSIKRENGLGNLKAKEAAFEAVGLRYDLSEKRIRNIIKEANQYTPEERLECRTLFFLRLKSLEELLKDVLKNEFGR